MNVEKIGFPMVKEIEPIKRTYPENYIFPEEWFSYQYKFMKRYFLKVLSGWSIMQYFGDEYRDEIAVYSLIDFTDIVIEDICRLNNKIYLADKNADNFKNGYQGYLVLDQNHLIKLYDEGVIKKIIVCNFFHANEIMQELLDLGVELDDLVTVTAILVE